MRGYQSLIRKIKPMDDEELRDKKTILNWLNSGEQIYYTENPDRHLCAYFPLVNPKRTHMFLVHHVKSGLWLPTGGHVERGESLRQTVVRELKEELGLSWKDRPKPFFISQITTVGKTAGHIHNDTWFLVEVNRETKLKPNRKEFHNWGWFSLDEASIKSSEPNIARAIKKIKHFL